jgi:MoaA/NifB/PqqE/SkfB family radical SAM enzyme
MNLSEKSARQSLPLVLSGLPVNLYIEVTKNCNEKCTMCPRTYYWPHRRDNLTFEDFKRIVDNFPRLERVVLHGLGEPLLNPELFEMVYYLKARGAYVLFNSNALALNAARREALLASGLDEYRVSFDASQPATYKKIRGIAALTKVKANVTALMQLVRKSGTTRPRVSLWFTTMHENLPELVGVVQFAIEAGVPEVYVQRLVYFGQGLAIQEQSLYNQLNQEEDRLLAKCATLCRQAGITFVASGNPAKGVQATFSQAQQQALDEERPWLACTRPWRLMYIQANGDVSPCCFAPFTGEGGGPILGNVFIEKPENIWQGEPYQQFRRAFVSHQPPQCCEGCGAKWNV